MNETTKNSLCKIAIKEKKLIRAYEIVKEFPIGLSTIWLWAKQGTITSIKVSKGITVFKREEIEKLFNGETNES